MSNSSVTQGLWPTRLLCSWDFPRENTRVGCHFLLQGILPTQGLNLHLLHWPSESLPLSHQRNPVKKLPATKSAVWVNSGSWWWTGRPGMLQFMGLQRVRHNWVTELNWTELKSAVYRKSSETSAQIICNSRHRLYIIIMFYFFHEIEWNTFYAILLDYYKNYFTFRYKIIINLYPVLSLNTVNPSLGFKKDKH